MAQLLHSNNISIHFFNRDSIEIQESIPVGFVPSACANCASIATGVSTSGDPEGKNIEQVSSDGHQISLAGVGPGLWVPVQ